MKRKQHNMGLIDPGGVAHPTGVSEAHKGGRATVQTLRLMPNAWESVGIAASSLRWTTPGVLTFDKPGRGRG